jgi:hypothetical protein
MRTCCLSLTLLLVGVAPACAQGKRTLADRVHDSIRKGVSYLLTNQGADGGWEHRGYPQSKGGTSALVTLALLNAGVTEADRPRLEKAIQYVRDINSDRVYVRALQTMALVEASLDPRRRPEAKTVDLELIRKNVQWLIDARVVAKDGTLEGWAYSNKDRGFYNSSTTQYAVLGLWAGKQAGVQIKRELWEQIREYYIRTQNPKDGFWVYDPDKHFLSGSGEFQSPSITMSTAGLTGLLIAGMELNGGREELRPGGAIHCGKYDENRPAALGLDWLGKHFAVSPAGRTFYHLYGVERAGRLSGLRFFGEHDWYREGSEHLVEKQQGDGFWSSPGNFDQNAVVSTAFALLFLSKGRTPVLISKTVHGVWPRKNPGQPGFDLDWNNDRNDLRHLVSFASKELFKNLPLAWQTYDLMWAVNARSGGALNEEEQADVVSEMLQSPIFYITGHDSPLERFTATERNLLKRYVESGGFIFAEACCSSEAFDAGFKKLVDKIWERDSELTYLPSDHAVWSSFFSVTPGEPSKLMGLNLGCKTVLIYSPQDLSCVWESGNPEKYPAAFRVGANVIAYATGMQPPRPRLTQMPVASNKTDTDTPRKRGFFQVGQVAFNGEWNPAPKAMTRVMEHVRGYANVDVLLKPEKVKLDDDDVIEYKFLYLHGRVKPGKEPFAYTDADLKGLRFNLENGGLLFADACCGDENFDKAFRAFVKGLFPKLKLEQVPLNDELFGKQLNGEALSDANIKCRQDRKSPPAAMAPWLEGIHGADGRWLVLYSKYDVGCALEGHQSLGCLGYDPASALKLARAAVLYNLRP